MNSDVGPTKRNVLNAFRVKDRFWGYESINGYKRACRYNEQWHPALKALR